MDSQIRQNLAIHVDAGLFQSKYELVVVQAVRARSCANAYDPEPAKVAFADLPVAIGVSERLFNRLFCKFIQFALIEVITLSKTEKFFTAIMPFRSAFNSRHVEAPYLFTGRPACSRVRQHAADFRRICIGRNDRLAESSFPACRFLRKNVPRERMAALDFAGRRYFEALGRASMGF